jgi:hypothetical protein
LSLAVQVNSGVSWLKVETMKEFSTKERVQVPYHHIDPGFINRRVCFSTFGKSFWEEFENRKREGNDHWTQLLNDHLLVDLSLAFCKAANVKSLGEVLTNVCEGTLFCSTEEVNDHHQRWWL